MPQFVNTQASQRVVVSIHAGGLGVFGGEGAQRCLGSEHAWHGAELQARAQGLPGAPLCAGAPRVLRVWHPRDPSRCCVLQHPSLGVLLLPCDKSCPHLQRERGFSALRCWCLQVAYRNQRRAGTMQRRRICRVQISSSVRSKEESAGSRGAVRGHAKNCLAGGFS